ncbi:MAG: acyltransferase [Pseudomonadota bacterium]
MAKLDQLQALRAIAALLVVVSHAIHEAHGVWGEGSLPAWLYAVPGDIGVDIFFVLSGFIMVYASRDQFGRAGAVVPFLLRRFARIAPLYWALTTILFVMYLVIPSAVSSPPESWQSIAASYAFFPFAREDELFRPLLALGWTLNYEMFFYAIFAFLLALPMRIAIPMVLAVLTSLSLIGFFAELPGPLAFWTNSIILEFGFGVALASVFLSGVRLPALACVGLLLASIALFAFAPPFNFDVSSVRFLYFGVPAILLVASFALAKRSLFPTSKILVAMGDASYSTYLSHPFALAVIAILIGFGGLKEMLNPLLFVVLCTLVSAIGGQLVYWIIEKPLSRWARKAIDGSIVSPPRKGPNAGRLTAAVAPKGTRRGYSQRTA